MFSAGRSNHPDAEPVGESAGSLGSRRGTGRGEYLPLDGRLEPLGRGWLLRLPLRADRITTEKQTVVAERVVVRRKPREEVAHISETVRREELQVETRGSLRARRARGRVRGARRSSSTRG